MDFQQYESGQQKTARLNSQYTEVHVVNLIMDWTSCGCEVWRISEINILVTRELYQEVWTH